MSKVRRRDLPHHITDFDRELLETLCEDKGWNAGDIALEVEEDYLTVKEHIDDLGIQGDPTRISLEPAVTLWTNDPEDILGGEKT